MDGSPLGVKPLALVDVERPASVLVVLSVTNFICCLPNLIILSELEAQFDGSPIAVKIFASSRN
jgi:hypothetical protein